MPKVIVNRPLKEHRSTIEDAMIGKLGRREYGKLLDGLKATTRKRRRRS